MNNEVQQPVKVKITELPKENLLKTHIPLGISALSLALAIVSLVVTCSTTRASMRSSNFITVFNLIQEQEAVHLRLIRQREDLQRQEAAHEHDQKDVSQIAKQLSKISEEINESILNLFAVGFNTPSFRTVQFP